eukprot:TRINITY_DN21428_c0_g4_i1.p1 TRINITY_DN21428_c0_g4~~TRINITY_DN21428_c0_g4_i1.p1  ORF type:complete len:455 (+),score=54.34 TRINITY_DN21428_c0_g4_i1:69-1433(+)
MFPHWMGSVIPEKWQPLVVFLWVCACATLIAFIARKPVAGGQAKHVANKDQEFGGPLGCAAIIVASHVFMFWQATTLFGYNFEMFLPTWRSIGFFAAYHAASIAFARYMPGLEVPGQAKIGYLCNGYASFWATLAGAAAVHLLDVFDLTILMNEYPAMLSTGIVLSNAYCVMLHLYYASPEERFSVYDYFMGVVLHPRLCNGKVDIKMVAEARLSWNLLLLVTVGSWLDLAKRHENTFLNPALFMVIAHGVYVNAIAKGEHFIPYTWDMTTENFGWMLNWWNCAGVPLFYCYNSIFLAKNADNLALPLPEKIWYPLLVILYLVAAWVFDEANYHKCYFKAEMRGETVVLTRNLFPTMRHVKNPKYLKCEAGVLLIDGWYAWGRKIHYTADTSIALIQGLSCGFTSFMPYTYLFFFAAMITHRSGRDELHCREKYGKTWDKYLAAVPYKFIPGIY